MKFIVSRDILFKNLSALSGVLSNNSTMSILDNFLFTIEGETLKLTASDLDTTMTAVIELSNVEGEGSIAIPSKILLETLKLIPDTPVVFSINEEENILKFTAANGEYDSPCFRGEEYPIVEPIRDSQFFEINSTILQRAISKTIFATGNDELRANMMGILCELSNDCITFVATDAHKMVRYRNTQVKSDNFTSFILPKKPMNNLKGILVGLNESVRVDYTQESHHIQFSFANITLFTTLKEGKYPNYESVIPTENPNTFTVSRDDLLKSMRRVGIFSNQSTFQVRVSLSEEITNLLAEDIDYSNKAEENIVGVYNGTPMDIGFNSKFFREMLENIDSPEVRIEMSQPNRAVLILPTQEYSEGENLLMLIMPIMLSY